MSVHVSPSDVYNYLYFAKGRGFINSYERLKIKNRVMWKIETISTRYDKHHGIEWATIVLTSREACAFIEGTYAASKVNPTTRAGADRARWEDTHVMPHPFSS